MDGITRLQYLIGLCKGNQALVHILLTRYTLVCRGRWCGVRRPPLACKWQCANKVKEPFTATTPHAWRGPNWLNITLPDSSFSKAIQFSHPCCSSQSCLRYLYKSEFFADIFGADYENREQYIRLDYSGCHKQHLEPQATRRRRDPTFFFFLPTYIAVIDEAAQHTNDNDTYW